MNGRVDLYQHRIIDLNLLVGSLKGRLARSEMILKTTNENVWFQLRKAVKLEEWIEELEPSFEATANTELVAHPIIADEIAVLTSWIVDLEARVGQLDDGEQKTENDTTPTCEGTGNKKRPILDFLVSNEFGVPSCPTCGLPQRAMTPAEKQRAYRVRKKREE